MKRFLIASLLAISFVTSNIFCKIDLDDSNFSLFNVQQTQLYAKSGDTAAGVAAGLVGGALLTGAMTGGSRRTAREEAKQVSREKEADEMKRQMELQQYSQQAGMETKMNMLILALVILFLGIVAMTVMLLRKNQTRGEK